MKIHILIPKHIEYKGFQDYQEQFFKNYFKNCGSVPKSRRGKNNRGEGLQFQLNGYFKQKKLKSCFNSRTKQLILQTNFVSSVNCYNYRDKLSKTMSFYS